MILIPPEVQIKASIRPGCVYYFSEESFTSTEPHFFIVLNHSPIDDSMLLLVCPSSRPDSVRRRRKHLPVQTLVEIRKEEYAGFTSDSIVDCNTVIEKTVGELVVKLSKGALKVKPDMDMGIIQKLREAVQASPMVAEEYKELLATSTTKTG